ncbi:MAG: outer membrane lipoprotein-sorting protein [Acidobacteriota bacterium]|nr:outer membrane lipoprotein-sorting protein [Acidobacteriota bacterium]
MTRPNRIALLAAFAAALTSPQVSAQDLPKQDLPKQDLPKAETILDRFVEVTGGKAAYQKHTHEKMTGTIVVPEIGMTGNLTRYSAAPDKEYSSLQLGPLGKAESGFSGGVAWEKNALTGPRVKNGDEKAQAEREARFNAQVDWRKVFAKVETAGSEIVNGEDCYKVQVTPAAGKPETQFYSKKSGLLLKTATIAVSPMGEIPVEVEVSDYKTFDGVLVATHSQSKMGPQRLEITITGMNFDQPVAPEQFELPAEIKALVDKAAK